MATVDEDLISALRRPTGYAPPLDESVALARRTPVEITPDVRGAAVQDLTSESGRALRAGLQRFGAVPSALYGAGANLVSPGAGDEALETAIGLQRRAAEGGPAIQSIADVHGVGDALALGRNQALMALPDVVTTLAGGGIGGAAVKGLARRGATRAAEEAATRAVARRGAVEATEDSIKAQGADAARRAATADAIETATARRVPAYTAAADAASEGAVTVGRALGTVAGQYPSIVATSAEGAPDAEGNLVGGLKGASAEETAKILLGDIGASAIGALPEFRLLGRIGGTAATEAIAKNAQAILPRVAKEAGVQGALGAGTGLAQTAAQFAAHKWVNDNVDLLSPAAFQSYLDTAIAGGTLGGALGGGVEGIAALGARTRADGTPNPQYDELKTRIRENLASFAKKKDEAFAKARSAFGTKEGEPVAPEGAPVGAGPAATPTERAQAFGTDLGEGAYKVHKAAVDIFSKLNQHLSTDEGRAAASGAFADAVDSLKTRFDTAPFQAGVEATLKSYRDALARAKTPEGQADVQKAYGKVLEDHITDAAPDARASFDDHLNRLADNDALDDRASSAVDQMSQRFESGALDADGNVTRPELPVQQRVSGLETPLQNLIAGTLPDDSPLRLNRNAMQQAASAAEKWFLGKSDDMTAADFDAMHWVETVHPELATQWEAMGPRFAELQRGTDKATAADESARPDNTAMAGELQRALDARQAGEGDFIPGVNEKTTAEMPTKTLGERITQAEVGSPEHAAAQGELRARIYREGGYKGEPLTENLSSQKARDLWAAKDPTKNANTIGIGTKDVATKDGRTIQRRQALQLDNLISKKLAEEPGIGPKAALAQVLGDLHLAGIKVDPDTITPGVFYSEAGGEKFRLSPREAATMRTALAGTDKTTITREAAAVGAKVPPLKVPPRERNVAQRDRPAKVEEMKGDADNQIAGPELVPRKAPPLTQSGVADVRLKPSPYEGIVNRVRKAFGQVGKDAEGKPVRIRLGEGNAEQSRIAHEAGVEIGTAELAKQRDAGTINERRYAAEVRRLEDPETGAARKALRDAADGKFDTGKARETAPEDATPIDRTTLRNEADDALTTAYSRLTGESKLPPKAALEAKVKELGERSKLTDKERTFLSAARDAGLVKGAERTPTGLRNRDAQNKRDLTRTPEETEADAKALAKQQKLTMPKGAGLSAKSEQSAATPGAGKAHDATLQTKAALANEVRGKRVADDKLVDQSTRLADDEGILKKLDESVAAENAHDLKAEARALNAVLDKMGIKERVRVGAHATKKRGGGYIPGTGEILVGAELKGAERMEVLAHELGHHIIRTELARAMDVDAKSIQDLSMHQVFEKMAVHQPELHAAINADFEAWRDAHSDLSADYNAAYASKKAVHRAENATRLTDNPTLRDAIRTRPEMVDYLHSFEEYVADQISRALTHSEAKTPVAKFFKGIADKLKLAYETLFQGKGGSDYAPAPSVEKWVQQLFDRTTLDVSQALGESTPGPVAKTVTEAALHAAAAALPPTGGAPPPPGGAGRGASPTLPPQGLKALVKFIRYRLPGDSRQVLDQVLSRGKALRALNEIYKDQPGALKAMRDPEHGLEARIAYAYLAQQRGDFTSGPRSTSVLRTLGDDLLSIASLSGKGALAERIFNDIANGRIETMRAAGRTYDVAAREAAYRGQAQAVYNKAVDTYQRVRAPLGKAFDSSIARMRDTGVPAIRRIGAQLQRHTGEAGEDPGLLPAVTHVTDRFMRAAGKALEGLSERETLHALNALQRQDTAAHYNGNVDTAVAVTRKLFDEFHAYARGAGMDIGKIENYFPVLLDLKTPADTARLSTLLSQPKFETAIREVMGQWEGPTSSRRAPSEAPIGELVQRLVEAGQGMSPQARTDFGGGSPPEFRAANYRLMNFIYKLGDEADKKTFASLQSKSPADIFVRYVQPLVRQAEFSRRFGSDGGKLTKALEEAKKQGADDAAIKQTQAAVDGAMGRVGIDGSPTLRAVFGDTVANKVRGPGVRKGISYLQAYENARLLPLSLISSLVDPMGIAVRTGGDFKTAWSGFKLGMKSLVDKQTKAEVNGMLQALGSADDFLANDILSSNFGRADGGARRINDFIFKANGLAGWTKTTRFMALQAAHGFLVKHGEGSAATSKRYLDELGVRPGDITAENGRAKILTPDERAAATPADRARDDRVRSALLRFVDEAILRPTSQQAPNWYADPYVGLVTQYKHFAYAIQDQIGRRIALELRHGNASALVPALSYLPVIIMAEMLRGGLQFGPGGNPNRKDWGPEEYTAMALDRSGLLGPKLAFQSDALSDPRHGNLPGTSFLGPAAQQVGDVYSAASGRRSATKTLESALPGAALYKHWNDGEPDGQQRSGMQRRAS